MKLPKDKVVRIQPNDYVRLKKYSDQHYRSMGEIVGDFIKKLEVKPLESEVEGKMICCECEEEIPNNCHFCPACGAEFELDENDIPIIKEIEDESDEDDSEDEDKDEE